MAGKPQPPNLADIAVRYLASKDRGAYIAELAPNVLEGFVVELLEADPRLSETNPGRWELAERVEAREQQLAAASAAG